MVRLKGDVCQHGNRVCECNVRVTDAGKRMSEAIGLANVFHAWDERVHSWMAFSLANGETDHVLYPSKTEAAKHRSMPERYAYVFLRSMQGGMSPRDAELYLDFYRDAADKNMQMADPFAPQLIQPLARNSYNGG